MLLGRPISNAFPWDDILPLLVGPISTMLSLGRPSFSNMIEIKTGTS